jgi:uncharacterized protein
MRTSIGTKIGVISDTHGPVGQEAQAALEGVDHIVHAGDVVDSNAISTLWNIAPVTAVRGNMDGYDTKHLLKPTETIEVGCVLFHILHDLGRLDIDPRAAQIAAVIHGHTHRAEIEWRDTVLYLNPGSAARPRGSRPPSIARITITKDGLKPEIIELA